MEPICFYHSADLDGACSGAIVHKAHGGKVQMVGINYGQPFPWEAVKGREVYMVDFALQPWDSMERLVREASHLVWIDHHKTAIEDYQAWSTKTNRTIFGLQENGKAGCELTWSWFYKDPVPLAVTLLGRYDVWDESHPQWERRILPFQAGMKMQPHRPWDLIWGKLLIPSILSIPESQSTIGGLIEQGLVILAYEKQRNEGRIKGLGFVTEFEGLRALVANMPMTNSQLFDAVWNHDLHDLMIAFYWKRGQWVVSLYSNKPGVDCGALAKKHGGGGHVGAAGFQCAFDALPFRLTA